MPIRVSAELSHICPLEDITAHAAALASGRFYRVWVPDTVVSPWEAWLAASLTMQTTSRIGLGLGATNPYTRHAVVMAQMAATMQQASGGRVNLCSGRGNGGFREEAGVVLHATPVEEWLVAVRGLLAGAPTRMRGPGVQIDAMLVRTHAPAMPLPIFLAAIGPAGGETALRV